MIGLLDILILIFDVIVSIWNAYASGYNIGLLRRIDKGGFNKVASYAGLCLAFAGMVYALIVILSFLAYIFGYVAEDAVDYAVSLDFLVFGVLIIGFGCVIAIQSIIIASERRNAGSILVALYNGFVEILDIGSYISGFKDAVSVATGNKRGEASAMVIVIVAVLIGFFIIFAAFKQGFSKAGYGSDHDWY